MIFEKINKIKTSRRGRKARLHKEQGPDALPLASAPRGAAAGERGPAASLPVPRWPRTWELARPVQAQGPLPPSPGLPRPLPRARSGAGPARTPPCPERMARRDHTEAVLLRHSSDAFQANTQSGLFWPKGNIYNQIIHLRK